MRPTTTLIAVAIVLIHYFLNAQMVFAQAPLPCGTKSTLESRRFYDSIKEEVKQHERYYLEQYIQGRSINMGTSVPIKAHIIRPSTGDGGLSETVLNDAIAEMNSYYINAGVEFFLCDGINYIDDDTYYNITTSEVPLVLTHNVANMINIYFARRVYNICGQATLSGAGPFPNILMRNSCVSDGSTLSHEMGHYYSLEHTHGTSNTTLTDELVDGSNCETAGDLICDTPADPKLGTGNVNYSCQYTGSAVDANSDPFDPDPRNIMAYGRLSCRDMFSPGQYARIYGLSQNFLSGLQCPSFNVDFTADVTQ
ncbi:MAG: M43 family zinc metalloprotease, partial [Bacteroidota bacterium]